MKEQEPVTSEKIGGDDLVGQTILDQFRVLRPIAKGGMGQVYLAQQVTMDRYAAIKLLQVDSSQEEHHERFRREARTLSKLTHPNIITVYNFGELADGRLFLAMEYAEGISLANLLAMGPLPTAEAVEIARQCADALAYAHQQEVVHRDFKPGNVMLTHVSGRVHVKVLDFGIARAGENSCFTRDGALLGTPQYMSPEQCRGEAADRQSDQYALGLVLYEMLTGKPAITASSPYGFLQRHQSFTPPPPSLVMRAPHLSPLDGVVMRMQAKDAAKRYPDVDEALEELNNAVERLFPGSRKTPTGPNRVADTAGRNRTSTGPGLPALEDSRVLLLGPDKRLLDSWLPLSGWGCRLVGHHRDLEAASAVEEWDLCIMVLPEVCGDIYWSQNLRAGLRPHRTLVCIDAPLESENLRNLCAGFSHFLVSPFPVNPEVLRCALTWLRQSTRGSSDLQLSSSAVPVTQITSSEQKDTVIANLLEDVRAEKVRRPVVQAVGDLADEMIMNAIFDAPVDEDDRPRHIETDRAATIELPVTEAVTVRWAIRDQHIAVAVRDQFGSLTPVHVLDHITGAAPAPRQDSGASSGMGLRMMSRAAQHLFFAISASNWCEVMGMVNRVSTPSTARSRSLVVLQGLGQQERRIGRRLTLFECSQQGGIRLRLEGEIDETCDLSSVFNRVGNVWLDLGGVSRINSVGIRKWLQAAKTASSDLLLLFERCAPPIVAQINMIPAFAATGQIRSILVPYLCGQCGTEFLESVRIADLDTLPPERQCGTCFKPLVFDDIVEEYFAFLER
jgi:serine/threonine-protein kinase